MGKGVFISYSHEDKKYVDPIVKLIRTMREDLVFQDTADILPGKLWEPQLLQTLSGCQIIVVFWCRHSASSKYVKKEYSIAIKEGKDILPVLLDNTEPNSKLSLYQWIDLRGVIRHPSSGGAKGSVRLYNGAKGYGLEWMHSSKEKNHEKYAAQSIIKMLSQKI